MCKGERKDEVEQKWQGGLWEKDGLATSVFSHSEIFYHIYPAASTALFLLNSYFATI